MSDYNVKGQNHIQVNQATMRSIAQMWLDEHTYFGGVVESVKASDYSNFSIQFVNKEET